MDLIKRKVRISFCIFCTISIGILMYNNHLNVSQMDTYSNKVSTIVFIFIIALGVVLYIVYESYRLMYSEMTDQMDVIKASERDLQTTYDSVSMMFIELDWDGKIINANRAVSDFSGLKKKNIIGKSLELILKFEKEAIEQIEEIVNETVESNRKSTLELETGYRIFDIAAYSLEGAKDKREKVLVVFDDITKEKEIYGQMLQDNKMVAVGQLAAGVAHEIRNPLGVIRNYCHLIKSSEEEEKDLRAKAVATMEEAVDRASGIIENLLNFSRISNTKWERMHLKEFIEGVIAFEEHALVSSKVEVILNCPENIKVKTIRESLSMILINLFINGIDSMTAGGEIKIDCYEEGEFIGIFVSDDGSGIEKDIIENIFNPFFTTKTGNQGSGLGLYIAYNEVQKLGGKITVESQEGKGTRFNIIIPRGWGEKMDE